VRPSTSALCASGHAAYCPPQQRRARCGRASPNSGCHPLHLPLAHRAKARQSAVLSGFGRTDTYTCSFATRLSPKAASLVPFLPRQERNRPPHRRKAVTRGAASPQLQTPQPRRTAARTHIKANRRGESPPAACRPTSAYIKQISPNQPPIFKPNHRPPKKERQPYQNPPALVRPKNQISPFFRTFLLKKVLTL
jgi:hypothetical protein